MPSHVTCKRDSTVHVIGINQMPAFFVIELIHKMIHTQLHLLLFYSCPRLLAFPVDFQRRILSFIHRHREKFSVDVLVHLIDTIQSKQTADEWVSTLLRMIHQYCKSQQRDKINAMDEGTEKKKLDVRYSEPVYTFSPSSQSTLKDFFTTLQSMQPSSVQSPIMPESDVKIKTEEDYNMPDEAMVMDVDVDESPTEMKPFIQSQSRNISWTRSQLRCNFETSFISQRSCFLEEEEMQVNIYMFVH